MVGQLAVGETLRPDPRLVERFRNRDPEALGTLFDLFAPNIYAFLTRAAVSPFELDALVEEVIWTVWVSPDPPRDVTDLDLLLRRALGSCLRRRFTQRAVQE